MKPFLSCILLFNIVKLQLLSHENLFFNIEKKYLYLKRMISHSSSLNESSFREVKDMHENERDYGGCSVYTQYIPFYFALEEARVNRALSVQV